MTVQYARKSEFERFGLGDAPRRGNEDVPPRIEAVKPSERSKSFRPRLVTVASDFFLPGLAPWPALINV
jgi:hypothetical protein